MSVSSSSPTPPSRWISSSTSSLDDVDDVVDGDDADQTLARVDHGRRNQIILLELVGDVFLFVVDMEDRLFRVHDVGDLGVARRAQDAAHRDRADQAEARVDHEHLDEAVGQVVGCAHVVDGLANGPERRHGDQLDLHQPAGGVFRVFQAALDRQPVGDRDLGEDFRLLLRLQPFEQIDPVIGLELGNGLGHRVRRQDIEHFVEHLFVKLGQRRIVDVAIEQLDELFALLRAHQLHEVGKIGLVQALRQQPQPVGILRVDRVLNRRHEVRRQDAVFVMDFKLFGGVGHLDPVLLIAPVRPSPRDRFLIGDLPPRTTANGPVQAPAEP